MNIIKKIPVPVSGLILAILSLGNLLAVYNSNIRDGGINAEEIFGCTGTGL